MHAQQSSRPQIVVRPTADFEVTGSGTHPSWASAEWTTLRRRQADGHPYDTRVKVLYSKTALYVLFDGTDRTITSSMTEDFMELWHEDVYELFLWTDEAHPIYFEYQISPLAKELVLLVPNFEGRFLGWRPWRYTGDRLVRKATTVTGGQRASGASIQGWRAEIAIPYAVLEPLNNVPPAPGTRWRANFYRMDYDNGTRTQWDWAPVGESFHEFEKYGELVFER